MTKLTLLVIATSLMTAFVFLSLVFVLRCLRALRAERERTAITEAEMANLRGELQQWREVGSRLERAVAADGPTIARGAIWLIAALFIAGSALAQNRIYSCKPAISVLPGAQTGGSLAVDVYWDVSGSMHSLRQSTDLVASTLDSSILQLAGATRIRHFSIGDDVREMKSASDVGSRPSSTALHRAAGRIGQSFANRVTGAAIIVSDLELVIPRADLQAGGNVCPDVPMPSRPEAGAIFGRCFSAASRSTLKPSGLALFVSFFERTTSDRHFFILIIAGNVALGRSIDSKMQERWRAANLVHTLVVDTQTVRDKLDQDVRCTWSSLDATNVQAARSAAAGSCSFLCTGEGGITLHIAFNSQDVSSGWVTAVQKTIRREGALVSIAADKRSMNLTVACPDERPPRPISVGGVVGFTWKFGVPSDMQVSQNARDLLVSLLTAVTQTVDPPSATIHVSVR